MELEAEVAKLKEQNQELQKKQVIWFCDYIHISNSWQHGFIVEPV